MKYEINNSKRPITPAILRFIKKFTINENGCWMWTAFIQNKGYGTFYDQGRMFVAHRWSYEYYIGKVPDGLQLDHLCRNRACVNPHHLEPVTNQENCQRGLTGHYKKELSKKLTHCLYGHEYTPENTSIIYGRFKRCKKCSSNVKKARYAETKHLWLDEYNAKRRRMRAERKSINN